MATWLMLFASVCVEAKAYRGELIILVTTKCACSSDTFSVKHPFFKFLGDHYPHALEAKFDRILIKIEQLWDKPEIEDYFSDLLVDRRGGRQGFPKDVMTDLMLLRDARDATILRKENDKENALAELKQRDIKLNSKEFLNAVNSGDPVIVDLFVRCNFNIQIKDEAGVPALLIALKKGFTVIARILINAGADVNSYDKMGMTPLLLTCGKQTQGFKSIAEALIKRGAFVNDRDPIGLTPLTLALSAGALDIAELLIKHGADVNARTKSGHTPLSLAKSSGNDYIVELLLIKGAK